MRKRTFILASAIAAAILCAPRATFADYAKEFNVKFAGYQGSTTLTNFPALIRLSQARNNFDYSKCELANGADTRFFDAEGNLLPSEVDTWNSDGESLVWVSVPELNRDTVITVRYGNAAAPEVTASDVWTNGYVAVWHMNAAEGTFTQRDSTTTGKNLNGANNSDYRTGMLCGVEGAVGKAAELGRGGVLTGGFSVSDTEGVLDGFSALTLEAWTYQSAYPTDNHRYLLTKKGSSNNAYYIEQAKNAGKLAAYVRRTLTGGSTGEPGVWQDATYPGAALNEWTHQVFRWNGDTDRSDGFLNGINVITYSTGTNKKGTMVQVGGSLYVGNLNLSNTRVFPGKMDEVRISSVARSDDWVVATHDTIASDDFAVFEVQNDWKKYAHKFSVAFPGVAEGATLENFPVLVKVSEAGIPGFSYADCAKAGGSDLRFTDGNGTEPLPCEVEIWDPNGESLIWVKVPTLTKDTRIRGCYGWNLAPAVDSTEVWDANYVGVWHMNAAAPTDEQKDSTVNGKHLATDASYRGGMECRVGGVAGHAVELGQGDVKTGGYSVPDTKGILDGFSAITLESWTYQTAYVSPARYIINKQKPGVDPDAYYFQQLSDTYPGKMAAYIYKTNSVGTQAPVGFWQGSSHAGAQLNEWTHQVFRWRGDTGLTTGFLNGVNVHELVADNSRKGTGIAVGGNLYVGNYFPNQEKVFPGKIDEVRISKVARSDAWVKATYDTIADNATFTRYGTAGDNSQGSVIFFQ